MNRRTAAVIVISLFASFLAVEAAEIAVTNARTKAVCTIPAPTARLVYGSHGKQHIELWLPESKAPEGGRALAVYVHGGSWTGGTAIDAVIAPNVKKILDRGIALASVSYRLLQDADGANPPVKAVKEDVVAALLKLKASAPSFGIDAKRLGLIGGSAGACISLTVSLADGNHLAIPFVAALYPQTTLDPKEMKEWVPNQGSYGAHAFGIKWDDFFARRAELMPEIEKYSPAALARKIEPAFAPEIFMEYYPASFPAAGRTTVKDPIHSAQFGIGFEKLCRERGIEMTLAKVSGKPKAWDWLADKLDGISDAKIYPPGTKLIFNFDTPSLAPVIYGGESRAENASATDYSLYLDIEHTDGTWTYVERTFFRCGTHGWHKEIGIFVPKKPVKLVSFNMLLRGNPKGKVEFRRPFAVRPSQPGEFGVTLRSDRPFSECDVREGLRFDGKVARKFFEKVPASLPTCNPLAAGEFAVWTAPSTRMVTPLDFPTADEREMKSVLLDLARGERESFQVNLSAGAKAGKDGVTLEIGRFVSADGKRFEGEVKWERVGYLKRENGYTEHPDAPLSSIRWFPDPLLPAAPMRVRCGGTQGAWVTAHAPHGAAPGVYEGTVKVVEGGKAIAEIPVKITVRSFALDKYFAMPNSFSVMDGFTRAAYPGNYVEMKRRTWDIMLDHRLNPDDISRTELPKIEDLLYARSRGMNLFNILNIVPEPKKPVKWVCFVPPKETDTDEFHTAFMDRVRPYYAELKKRGLAEFAYIYGFDERGSEYYPGIKRFCAKWKARFPEIPVMTTAMMYKDMARAGGDTNRADCLTTDWFCPLTPEYKEDFSARLREDWGLKTWWYVCCSPRYPYANIASYEHPAREGRILGWQTWTFKADGLLYWHVNFWPDDIKLDPSDTFFPEWPTANSLHMPGDGIFLYPGVDDVYASIRLASVRDGAEDFERLDAASKVFGRALVDKAVRRVTPGVSEFDRSGEKLLRIRRELADRMEKASASPAL